MNAVQTFRAESLSGTQAAEDAEDSSEPAAGKRASSKICQVEPQTGRTQLVHSLFATV